MKLNALLKNEFDIFNSIIDTELKKKEFVIDCTLMPSFKNFDFWKRKEGFFGELFIELDKLSNPCLYWFEIENDELVSEIKKVTNNFREDEKNKINKRTIPAKNKNIDSNCLYVGIRQGGIRKKDGLSNIAGRIFQHLGYYRVGSTQGLQLVHWARKYTFKLTVVELPKNGKNYLNIVERLLANQFKPILGKH